MDDIALHRYQQRAQLAIQGPKQPHRGDWAFPQDLCEDDIITRVNVAIKKIPNPTTQAKLFNQFLPPLEITPENGFNGALTNWETVYDRHIEANQTYVTAIHLGEEKSGHWVTLAFNLERKKAFFIDSLNGLSRDIKTVKRILFEEGYFTDVKIFAEKIQTGGNACELYVAQNIIDILKEKRPRRKGFTQKGYDFMVDVVNIRANPKKRMDLKQLETLVTTTPTVSGVVDKEKALMIRENQEKTLEAIRNPGIKPGQIKEMYVSKDREEKYTISFLGTN
jgi:hypothetical protein